VAKRFVALLASLAERVNRFLEKYSGEMFRVDSRELELPGITTRMRPLVALLVVHTLAFRPAAHNAALCADTRWSADATCGSAPADGASSHRNWLGGGALIAPIRPCS
jgi:hypothetical protein